MRCECGEPIEPGQKFCIGCGKELGDSAQSDKTAVLPPIVPDEPDSCGSSGVRVAVAKGFHADGR